MDIQQTKDKQERDEKEAQRQFEIDIRKHRRRIRKQLEALEPKKLTKKQRRKQESDERNEVLMQLQFGRSYGKPPYSKPDETENPLNSQAFKGGGDDGVDYNDQAGYNPNADLKRET